MRKTLRLLCSAAGLVVMGAALSAQGTTAHQPGIYVQEGAKETRIAGTITMGAKPKGMVKSMLTGGLSKGSTVFELPGVSADVRAASGALFVVYLDPDAGKPARPDQMMDISKMQAAAAGDTMPPAKNGSEFVLIPLAVEGDSRIADIPNGNKNKNAVDFAATQVSVGVYKLQPKSPLTPGEYAFYWHMPGTGGGGGQFWTFGVGAK